MAFWIIGILGGAIAVGLDAAGFGGHWYGVVCFNLGVFLTAVALRFE